MAETTNAYITNWTIKYDGQLISQPPNSCPTSTSTVSLVADKSGTITLSFNLVYETEYEDRTYSSTTGTIGVYWSHCNSSVTVSATNITLSTLVMIYQGDDPDGRILDSNSWSATWHNDNTSASTSTFQRLGYIDFSATDLETKIEWIFTLTISVDGTLWDASENPEKDGILFYLTTVGQVNP
jgi:hypothetical protein